MLYLIGIGLKGLGSMSIEGLETAKRCKKVYLESYTSKIDVKSLKKELKIVMANREMIEHSGDKIVLEAEKEDVAVLIIGDVFGATTHYDIYLRAKEKGVNVEVIGGESILSAVGIVGLSLYKYGKVASIPFENEHVKTASEIVKVNLDNDMHSLVLLDLDPGKKKFLTLKEGIDYLIRSNVITSVDKIVGCARIGSSEKIVYGSAGDICSVDFGEAPYCIVVPCKNLHFMEEEALERWKPI